LAREAGLIGPDVLGSGRSFELELRVGAGAYVCGEETALLESLEGKRGMVRAKPPLPAHVGLFGKPTVINNLVSLASVPVILAKGAKAYADYGLGRSRGTMPIQIAGNAKYTGLFEAAFGITLGEIIETVAGGTLSGRPVKAVQCGGPLGAYFPPSLFDTPYDYEAFTARDGRDVVVCANTDRMWQSLCEAAGLQELGAEPDLATRRGRYYHRDRIIAAFDKAFAEKDADDWVSALLAAGVPVGTVNTVGEALANPQVSWRNMILELTDDEGHHLRVAGNPIKLPHDGEQHHTFPPRLAQHTHEVMSGVLGLSEQEILSLETRGVLRLQSKSEAP
jgi:hypothetical protein